MAQENSPAPAGKGHCFSFLKVYTLSCLGVIGNKKSQFRFLLQSSFQPDVFVSPHSAALGVSCSSIKLRSIMLLHHTSLNGIIVYHSDWFSQLLNY